MARIIPEQTTGGGGGAPLSSAIPQSLGVASAGVGTSASRDDHVHAMPSLNDLSNVSVAAPNDLDVLTYDNATSTWIAAVAGGGGGGTVDPYLVINSGPPNGFFGFPGDVLLSNEAGVARPLITRYLSPTTAGTFGSFIVSPNAGEANVALVLNPKGLGGLQAQVADGTILGGDARGNNAVDWQTVRNTAAQVASGADSVVGGGGGNTASNYRATVAGGDQNRASGGRSTVGGGQSNTASATNSTIAGGQSGTASGTWATVGGGFVNVASNSYSTIGGGQQNTVAGFRATVGGGSNNDATGSSATVAGGERGLADQYGMFSHASGRFSLDGDAQFSRMVLRRQTTDATPTVLHADGGAGSASTRVALPAESAYCFDVYVIATQTGGVAGTASDSAWWHFRGGIKRDNSNNTTLIGTNISETGADAGASTWAVTVTADDTNEALQIEVTGEVDKTIRWVATVQYSRVAY